MSISQSGLKAGSMGWGGQFFQSMAHMAPAVAVIMTVQYMASRAGPAVPLATLFATLLALMLAYCLAQLTRKYHGASGYFQVHSRAIGSRAGFITSWLFLMYEPFVSAITMFGFGVLVLEPFSKETFGFVIPWWSAFIIGHGIVFVLAIAKIKNAILATAVLGLFEFAIILALAVLLIVKGDGRFHPEFFSVSTSADGIGGLMFSFIFGFMMFVGYESGLPLAEETDKARSAIFKSLIVSVIVAGIFYTFVSYASVAGFGGTDDPQAFAKSFSAEENPYGGVFAIKAFGWIGPWLILFAAVNSTIACCLASQNAAIRVFYALGRAKIFPAKLGKVSKDGVPFNATVCAALVSYGAGLILFLLTRDGDAVQWFGFLGILMVLPLLIIHLVTCVSTFIAYKFKEKNEFNALKHAVIPGVTGLLVLLPIWGAIYYNPTAPFIYAPWLVAGWLAFGAGIYIILKRLRPQSLKKLENETEESN